MIESVSYGLASRMQLQRDQASMSAMKQQIQTEQAMAQMLMDAAKNIEKQAGGPSGIGSIIDTYA